MSLLTSLIDIAVNTVKAVFAKAKFSEILMQLVISLPKAIMDAIQYGKISSVEKLEEALGEFDLRTGSDAGALDIIKDLPADKEEEAMDALRKIVEILGKNKLKVDGYYQEAA